MRPTYHGTRSSIKYKSEWMTVYEDWVSEEDSGTIGMFNRIEVLDAVIVVPILQDNSLLMVKNYRHGAGRNLLELPWGFINENELHIAWENYTEELCCCGKRFEKTFR
jgi:ADP-ribose pyrophosphatase